MISETAFVAQTTTTIQSVIAGLNRHLAGNPVQVARIEHLARHFTPGKLLRTRLAWHLLPAEPRWHSSIIAGCAAVEMIHSATLFHDDVIDGASLRRGQPALWRDVGQTGAILLGDLFFSYSLQVLLDSDRPELTRKFVEKVCETCATESCHELLYRGVETDVATALRLARGKTGALFAFIGCLCGTGRPDLEAALEEASYLVGSAYQLADDLLDEIGDEGIAGKTLGTDRKRRKFTLAQGGEAGVGLIRGQVAGLRDRALRQLAPWPTLAARLEAYVDGTLLPRWMLNLETVQHLGSGI